MTRQYIKWTADDINYLRETWPDSLTHIDQMVERLKRTKHEIRNKANGLMLARLKFPRKGHWSSEEVALLIKYYTVDGLALSNVARCLHRTRASVERKISLLREKGVVIKPSYRTYAEVGFEKGRQFCDQNGYKIISQGNTRSPEDFIIEYEGEATAVNVKTGRCVIAPENWKRLKMMAMPIMILWFPGDESVVILKEAGSY